MDPIKNQQQPENKLHFLDYWRIIRIRKTVIIAVFLLVAITATVVTFILPESFSSTARIKIEQNSTDTRGFNTVGSDSMGFDPFFIQTEFEIIQDQGVLGKVIDSLNLNSVWGKKFNGGEALKTSETMEFLKRRLSLSPVRNTKLIEITVYSDDKDEAARIANAIADSYKNYRLNQLTGQTSGSIEQMVNSFNEGEMEIRTMQTNVDKLRQELKINDLDPQAQAPSPTISPQQVQQLNAMFTEGKLQYTQLQTQLAGLQALTPDKLREVLPTVQPDASLSELLSQFHLAQQQLVRLQADYSQQHPDVIRAQATVNNANKMIDERVSGIMEGLKNLVLSKKAALDSLSNDLEAARQADFRESAVGQPYWNLKRDLAQKKQYHDLLAMKISTEKMDLALPKTVMVDIIRRAEPSLTPVKPNKPANIILGVIIGLVVGVGLAFFIEYLDTSVKTIDDVERALQAPVLGVIPQNIGYLISEGVESQHAEAYRVLRTNILFSRKDDKGSSIVVVSAGAGEGKSTTTLNLATVFAQAGDRVLIVDSDLRRPTLHKVLRISNAVGLTNYLLKQNTLDEVIQITSLPTLHVMASGKLPSSSMSILNSAQMREMVTELKTRYDYVIFDSPPILGVSDASVLASEMDLAIQVIQYRRYPQPMNVRAKQLIEKVGGNLIGIVLNNINMSQDESYYYYSGYYHSNDYYSRNDDDQEAATIKTEDDDDADSRAEAGKKY
jgi:capsular exopolysaccharide synthesis family protein